MSADSKERVHIFCDGACSPNPGKGGWAAILVSGDTERVITGCAPHTTNNRMELTAAVQALSTLPSPCSVTITTDSRYLADCFRRDWLSKWQAKGWKTSQGKKVKNIDLWQKLSGLVQMHDVDWVWVRAHDAHPQNERADALAVQARQRCRDGDRE